MAANANRPNGDWASFSNTLRLDKNNEIIILIRCNFSPGNLNSIKDKSIVIPKNSIVDAGKTSFRAQWEYRSNHRYERICSATQDTRGSPPDPLIKNHLNNAGYPFQENIQTEPNVKILRRPQNKNTRNPWPYIYRNKIGPENGNPGN